MVLNKLPMLTNDDAGAILLFALAGVEIRRQADKECAPLDE